jgi:hypothetical protein
VIRGAGINVPVCVHPVRRRGSRCALLRRDSERSVEPLEALDDGVALLFAELARDTRGATITATTATDLHATPEAASSTMAATATTSIAAASSAALGSHVGR